MGFYEFRRQLEYETQLYGSKLVIVDRFYRSSKTCSRCSEKNHLCHCLKDYSNVITAGLSVTEV